MSGHSDNKSEPTKPIAVPAAATAGSQTSWVPDSPANDWCLANDVPYLIADIRYAVKSIATSTQLPAGPDLAHLNIETLENRQYCVRLSAGGFCVVSQLGFDRVDLDDDSPIASSGFETIYQLLDNISPSYRASFANRLTDKLRALDTDHHQV